MTTDRYYICGECAHFWASPEWPERCENCGASSLFERESVDAAAAGSQWLIDEAAREASCSPTVHSLRLKA